MIKSLSNEASPAVGSGEVAAACHRLEGVVRRINASAAALLKEEDLSLEQWRVVDFLIGRDETPMTELADAVLVPSPTVTRIVDKLVSRALVYRSSAMNDRRRVLVHLSRRGEELHARLAPRIAQVQTRAFEGLTVEQAEEFFALLAVLEASR